MSASIASGSERLLLRLAVEDFLFREAALLDSWELDEWLKLYTEDCRYYVPATDLPDGDPSVTLGLIDDDLTRLRGRVERLKSAKAYREFPWSRTRRLVSNVRVRPAAADGAHPQLDRDAADAAPERGARDARAGELAVAASFAAFRYRKGDEQILVGSYDYRLVEHGGGFQIRVKRIALAPEALRPHGTVSIIL